MDLSASSRLITSALTSLEAPLHEYGEGVHDEIHPDLNKDDKGSCPAPAATQGPDPSKDQQQPVSRSMDSSLIIPVPSLHFATSTPDPEAGTKGCVLSSLSVTAGSQDGSLLSPPGQQQDSASRTTGDLVLAAISVMKGRKARPDTKRLCNWVHRKYGRSVQEVVNEIDNLCAQGILEKVEYKGSISFRIVSDKKLHKRAGRRKSSNVNQNDTDPDRSKNETPKKVAGCAKKSPKKILEKSPDTSQPLTINFLVREQLNPGLEAVVSKTEIISAIETSTRPINKKNVFRDLETILAQEIHLGYLKKVNDDGYSLPSIENSKTYRGTISLKVSKRKPKPTQKVLEMESDSQTSKVKCESMEEVPDFENNENGVNERKTEDQLKDDLIKEKLISNKLFKMKNKIKATKSKIRKEKMLNSMIQNELKPLETGIDELHEKQNILKYSIEEVLESTEDYVKEEDKNEENFRKSRKKKETWQTTDKAEIENERKNVFIEKPNDVMKRKRRKKVELNGAAVSKFKSSTQKSRPSHKNSKLSSQEQSLDDEDDRASLDGPLQRTVSARKKRARKIFDPADHDPPQRAAKKSRVCSPASPGGEDKRPERAATVRRRGRARQSKSVDQESDPDTDSCLYCDQGDMKNEKLITCKDCSTTVHPSCLNYPEDLTDQIYAQPWQCINCKTCFVCNQAGDDVSSYSDQPGQCRSAIPCRVQEQMLFCDSCDLGYHMECHQPPITAKPQGRWECSTCARHTGFVAAPGPRPQQQQAAAAAKPELPLEKHFEVELPALPPGTGTSWQQRGLKMTFCAPGLASLSPADWEQLPVDETIPDISAWSAARVSQYLVQNGIQETHAKVFFDEELDGSSVLVMQRRDIISGLGLKLGPALKIYNRVRTLQLRRKIEF